METFPIAGQIINTKLIFGLTARDIGEALVLPFLGLGIAQSLGASGDLFFIATGVPAESILHWGWPSHG